MIRTVISFSKGMGGLVMHNPVSQLLRVADEPMSGIELRYGVPPLPTSAAGLNKLVESTMHELAGKESHTLSWRLHATAKLGVQVGAAD